MDSDLQILLAEDSEEDVFFLKRAFHKVGLKTRMDVVPDGDSAVNYLSGRGQFQDRATFPLPKLLILDLKMPGLNGFEVLRWVRSQPGLRRLPVLVFSSSDEERDVNEAHELGANGYSVKPNGMEGLERFAAAVDAYWARCHCFPKLEPPAWESA